MAGRATASRPALTVTMPAVPKRPGDGASASMRPAGPWRKSIAATASKKPPIPSPPPPSSTRPSTRMDLNLRMAPPPRSSHRAPRPSALDRGKLSRPVARPTMRAPLSSTRTSVPSPKSIVPSPSTADLPRQGPLATAAKARSPGRSIRGGASPGRGARSVRSTQEPGSSEGTPARASRRTRLPS